MRDAIETVRFSAEAKGLVMDVSLDEGATVMGDPDRLLQIAWNLLSNAIRFTAKNGQVAVRLRQAAEHVELQVEDTGAGIDPDFLPHVFEPFRQADQSMTREHGGLGLGLAIVRQLVELHGGSVSAKSEGDGKGSIFTVRFPRTIGEFVSS